MFDKMVFRGNLQQNSLWMKISRKTLITRTFIDKIKQTFQPKPLVKTASMTVQMIGLNVLWGMSLQIIECDQRTLPLSLIDKLTKTVGVDIKHEPSNVSTQ